MKPTTLCTLGTIGILCLSVTLLLVAERSLPPEWTAWAKVLGYTFFFVSLAALRGVPAPTAKSNQKLANPK